MKSECPNEVVCNYCGQSGHMRKDCDDHQELELGLPLVYGQKPRDGAAPTRSEAGSYIDDQDISSDPEEEGQESKSDADLDELTDELLLAAAEGGEQPPAAVVIGASIVKRLDMTGEAAVVAKSGIEAAGVQELLEQATDMVETDKMEKVILHLGTNDLMHNKDDTEVVKLNIAGAVGKVKDVFQNAEIGIAAIPPRKGKSQGIVQYNQKAKTVNHYIEMLAGREERVTYIDTYEVFAPRGGHVVKGFYSDRDPAGIHFSQAGTDALKKEFQVFLRADGEDSRKRMRSAEATPNSEEKSTKKGKQQESS